MEIGDLFARLGKINQASLVGYTITEIQTQPNKNIIRLEKGELEVGVLASDDGSFTFYWEQTNGNAQTKVEAITT